MEALLEANCTRLLDLYKTNLEFIAELQSRLVEDVLSDVVGELELDEETENWSRRWLEDNSELETHSRTGLILC